jgi:hypothetical protein
MAEIDRIPLLTRTSGETCNGTKTMKGQYARCEDRVEAADKNDQGYATQEEEKTGEEEPGTSR